MTPNHTQSSSEELDHILGNCSCDNLDMNCWMMRNNDPEFIKYLPEKQKVAIISLFSSHLQAYTDEIRREVISIGYEPPSAYDIVSRAIRENLRKKQRQALNNLATKWGVKL